MMKHEHKPVKATGAWSTLVMGLALGSGTMYLLGTKKGRDFLRQLLDTIEDLEVTGDELLDNLRRELEGAEIEPNLREKLESVLPENKIDSVLNKIKHVLPHSSSK